MVYVKVGCCHPYCLLCTYVNDIIVQLRTKRLGYCIGDLYLGCVIYADDLILMSSSLTVLQRMIDVCVSEATSELDMSFNAKKSAIIRVGRGFKNECKAVKLCGTDIPYESSTRPISWCIFVCCQTIQNECKTSQSIILQVPKSTPE